MRSHGPFSADRLIRGTAALLLAGALALSQTASVRVAAQSGEVAVDAAATASGVDASFLHCLAGRESRHDPAAVNWRGNWHGLFQYLPSTWSGQSRAYGFGGASVYDGWANAHVTAYAIADRPGQWGWLYGQWPPARGCGNPWR